MLALPLLLLLIGSNLKGQAPDLFISEYIEGSSSNKALEVYNGTGGEVSLDNYFFIKVSNPSGSETWADGEVFDFGSGVNLANDDVYIIYNSGADAGITDIGDETSTVTYFNGNDPVALINDVNANGTYEEGEDEVLDVIGDMSGDTWGGELTWVRQEYYDGNTTFTLSEWDEYEQNEFSYLGSHTYTGETPPANISNVTTTPAYPTSEETVTVSAEVTDQGTIDTVFVEWGIASGTLNDTIGMVETSGDTYESESDIPAHADGTEIFYKVSAVNGQNDTASTDEMSYTVVDPYVTLPYEEDFESADSFGAIGWSTQVLTGSMDWYIANGGDQFAEMTNFDTDVYENFASETWLITPGIDLSSESEVYFGFNNAYNYGGDSITVWASTNYNGDISAADWDSLAPELSSGNEEEVFSDYMDFSQYAGDTVHVAFKYTGTDSDGATWQIDDVSVVTSMGPTIANTSISPDAPTSSDAVNVSADVTVNGTIDTVFVGYGTTSGTMIDTIGMVNNSGDTYTTESGIPAQADGTTVYYVITGKDLDGNASSTEELSYDVVDPEVATIPFVEEFLADLGQMSQTSITGDQEWGFDSYGGDTYAKISGYSDGNNANEDWLITPALDLSNVSDADLQWKEAINFANDIPNKQEVYVSTDYAGTGNPEDANWDKLTITNRPAGDSWDWSVVDPIDLSSYTGNASVYVGFKYTSTTDTAATWEVDSITVTKPAVGEAPQIANVAISPEVPDPSSTVSVSADITDADGTIASATLHWGISAGAMDSTITMSVSSGDTYVTDNDIPAKEAGTDVFYRISTEDNDGNTVLSNQHTYKVKAGTVSLPFLEIFENDLGKMNAYSVAGESQEWYQDSYDESSYAKMSGYSGSAYENEDWLITPALDLSDVSTASAKWKEAIKYAGTISEEQELYVSTDYSGSGDPSSATWDKMIVSNRAPGDSWTFVEVDAVDLSGYAGESKVYLGFKYTSTTSNAATWEIDSISVTSEAAANIKPEISDIEVKPTEPEADEQVQINAIITDANPTDTIVATLHYGTAQDSLSEKVDFTATSSENDYVAFIPGQPAGTKIYFEIRASDLTDTVKKAGMYQVEEAEAPDAIHNQEELALKVYPNPGNGNYAIEIDSDVNSSYTVTVFNTVGKLVYQKQFDRQSTVNTINITDQNDGIYFLRIRSNNVEKVIKLIKE